MLIFLALLFAFPGFTAQANEVPSAHFLIVNGTVQFNGRTVRKDEIVTAQGLVKTATDGGAKIELLPSHTILELSPSSEAEIGRASPDGVEQAVLNSGTLRARVHKTPDAKRPTFYLKTASASMGVRGTDFFGVANPFLGESEIVVFEGHVVFASVSDPSDEEAIGAGYWGGIGGRFGEKTHALIPLPKSALMHFDAVTAVK